MEKLKNIHIDMINNRAEKVFDFEFAKILEGLEQLACQNKIVDYLYYEDMASHKYRHNINIKTTTEAHGEGSIYIGWQHNSAKTNESKCYDLKVEVNPSKTVIDKITYQDIFMACPKKYRDSIDKINLTDPYDVLYEVERPADYHVYHLLGSIIGAKVWRVIEFDIAMDFNCYIDEVICLPRQGRSMNLIQGTRYYGTQHKDMFLKIYDKAKERKEKANKDIGAVLTRLEFTIRPHNGNGILYRDLTSYILDFNKYYSIAIYDESKCTDAVKGWLICFAHGLMQFKDLHQKNRKKLVTYVEENLVTLDISSLWLKNFENAIIPIREWCFYSANDRKPFIDENGDFVDDFMKRLVYQNNVQWEQYVMNNKK